MSGFSRVVVVGAFGLLIGLAAPPGVEAQSCPKDSVRSGSACVDKYEASVWLIVPGGANGQPTAGQKQVIDSIRNGNVTLSDLNRIGAVQLGIDSQDLPNNGCPVTAAGCTNVYAVSIADVRPAAFINWFQALAAARNSFKRLPTNAEWQAAAFGTPDPGAGDDGLTTCNIHATNTQSLTGARSSCVSDVGAFDMVGNVWEWVADAFPKSIDGNPDFCDHGSLKWPAAFGNDARCLVGAATGGEPGALARGGEFRNAASSQTGDGVFASTGLNEQTSASNEYGFRGVR